MKATLSFKLPEEQHEHYDALNGTAYKSALQDFNEYLRKSIKYSTDLNEEQIQVYERIRQELIAFVNSYDLEI